MLNSKCNNNEKKNIKKKKMRLPVREPPSLELIGLPGIHYTTKSDVHNR